MSTLRRAAVVVVLLVLTVLGSVAPVEASLTQEAPSTTGVPAPDIIPRPDSGEAPTEAGDRGGALQLLVLGVVVIALGGGVVHVVRQARRAGSSPP